MEGSLKEKEFKKSGSSPSLTTSWFHSLDPILNSTEL
jgi:hypothetical protein